MYKTKFYNGYYVFLMILFQCWIKPAHLHRGLQHRNTCTDDCLAGISCNLRELIHRCSHLNLDRRILNGIRNRHSPISDEHFTYSRDWMYNRRPTSDGEVIVPGQDITNQNVPQEEQKTRETTQNLDVERQERERRLYNSRIGQALNYTLRKQIGRGAVNTRQIPQRPAEIINNFASSGRIPVNDRATVGRGMDDKPEVNSAQTTPPALQPVTSGASATCTACNENTACSEGNYCYYSPTCAMRICQPLG